MASLLERMSIPAGSGPSVGPVRAKSNRAAAASAAAPYVIAPTSSNPAYAYASCTTSAQARAHKTPSATPAVLLHSTSVHESFP
ncbi:uncharacterized protein TRAVEDRAFT_52224 [Trametes versicolor FP-101664 SS1]|uniref:uncharacterized protein n=1 Tax=Trametes versicolor (strain FP-101664) TaxID=717944 RepID=UPI00046245CA|nr:uncharacterized protein TRAVEDRAFT_52224 [Trametes versicolor FP-101664 SS1]EIW54517.1 hypothetical protein TRAVEDRAFT_52224 [Trametes versicolor FP-101664 SS1]